jgi:hypothetical protein
MTSRLVCHGEGIHSYLVIYFLRKVFLTKARVLVKDVLISRRCNTEKKSSRKLQTVHDHALTISYDQ